MALAIFDLDNTLLAGDSDHAWGNFLLEQGWVEPVEHQRVNDYFYQEYQNGTLDIHDYVRFVTSALDGIPPDQRLAFRQDFMVSVVDSLIAPGTPPLLARHRQQGDTLLIITATLDFITDPIARRLGVDDLIATRAERVSGSELPLFTGAITGIPAFQGGKVERLQSWLKGHPKLARATTWFYSDSHNDLPLLQSVDNPIAVDPDEKLKSAAERNAWPVITLRH